MTNPNNNSTGNKPTKSYVADLTGRLPTGAMREPNEMYPELQGVMSTSPGVAVDSSSRKQMYGGSHIGQALVIKNSTPRFCHTGTEFDYGRYTFNIEMPENGRIVRIIKRYPYKAGKNAFRESPQQIAIYENDNGEYGFIDLVKHSSNHSHFGFTFKNNSENMEKLRPSSDIKKGTVFRDSPAKGPNGEYGMGRELRVALLSIPGTVEDSIIFSEDELENYEYTTFERRTFELGSEYFPLNMCGNDDEFKIFPEIGDYITHENGLLMAFRKFDVNMVPVEQSVKAMQTYIPYFDKGIYADGKGGQIVDIVVYKQRQSKNDTLCDAVTEQLERYSKAYLDFYQEIIDCYLEIKQKRGGKVQLTNEFHALLARALAIVDYRNVPGFKTGNVPPLKNVHKMNLIDDWRIDITIKYVKRPNRTSKVTDCHGSKGVISQVWPKAAMPHYSDGTSAGLIMAPEARVNRMNFSSTMIIHWASCSENLVNNIVKNLGINKEYDIKEQLYTIQPNSLEWAFERISGFHYFTNLKTAQWYDGLSFQSKLNDLFYAVNIGLVVSQLPTDNDLEWVDIINNLDKHYPPMRDYVTYTTPEGKTVTTKEKVIMGYSSIILLEKTGKDYSSVAIAKTQQNGVIGSLSVADRYSSPTKQQPTRMGEAETRLWIAYGPSFMAPEIHDRSNSPTTRKAIAYNILNAIAPTNIDEIIDRNVFPYGTSKPIQLMKHLGRCSGFEMVYRKYDPSLQTRPEGNESSMEVSKEAAFSADEEN